ncbi:hypothetical protein CRUP_001976, partial [Coryphaenoides rupestris]
AGDAGGRRSPPPPPLPPSTRHKPQDSPRSAKVSFIFGGDPPRNVRGNYERLLESPDVPAHRPPYLRHNMDFGSSQDSMPFHYGSGGGSSGPHVYSNIGGEGCAEEPLLRDLCYADTTDDAEDDEDASCEEDSTGGTPVNDEEAGNGNGNHVPNCLNLAIAQGGLAAAAGKTTFLTLSGSTDDIIDLTALPPPEGDDPVAVDDGDDALLETLNLAIAAPPPGFRDSSDEDAAPEGRPLSTSDNDDIPVSLIDAVPTREDGGEGSRGAAERRLENAVTNTLQALQALSVADQRPPPRPHAPCSNPGLRTSRGFSPESSSDSGNETNSSEMTEISELAAAHRLNESHMRLLVATREGYQPLLEEKTEFPVSPSTGENLQPKPHSSSHRLLQPPAVPPRRSPLLDTATSGPDGLQVGAQARNCSSSTLQRPSSVTPGGKHHKKSSDSGGKYNTFSTRDGHWAAIGSSSSLLQLDQGMDQGGSQQRRQNSLMGENSVADGLGINSLPRGHRGPSRPPPPATSNRLDEGQFEGACGATDNGASAVEQDKLVVASLLSSSKKPCLAGSDHGSDVPSDHPPISRQQSVARLCEYHLAKRISNLQGEAHSSLQGSLCSSLDAGGSTNSSVGGTPTDSLLGPAPPESKHKQHQKQQQQHHHQHLQRHPLSSSSSSLLRLVNYEESKSAVVPQGASGQNKELHPHADPALLRKMLPNIHPPVASSEPKRPSSATPSKHKETSGTTSRRFHNDLHAKQQAYLRGLNQKEGSEAYRQLINYLTVSQMHQGGKLHSAGMGGAVKKDSRRYITSNPQLVDMVKNRGNTIAGCPCSASSSMSSPFVGANSLNPNSAAMLQANISPQPYHSSTLPTKLMKSPDMHAQRPRASVEVRHAGIERRSSLSGLEAELKLVPMDPEQVMTQSDRESSVSTGRERGCGREGGGGGTANRPPSRSRSQPSGGSEDWFKSDLANERSSVPFHSGGGETTLRPSPDRRPLAPELASYPQYHLPRNHRLLPLHHSPCRSTTVPATQAACRGRIP